MIKVIKILQGHKVTPKKQRMQMKAQKQQSTAHNSKNDTWTIVEYDKSHQNTAGTQTDTTSPRAIRLKPTACIINAYASSHPILQLLTSIFIPPCHPHIFLARYPQPRVYALEQQRWCPERNRVEAEKIKKELNSQEISDEWTQYNRHYLQVSQPNQLMLTDFLLEMVDIFILPVERLAREHIFVPSLDLQS